MKIKWLGHSCFKITEGDYSIVIDPYNPLMFPRLEKYTVSANQIICSHNHEDHNFKKAVTLIQTSKENPFKIDTLTTYHDDSKGSTRGLMTIHILEVNGIKIAHLGDIGCELEEDQIQKLWGLDFLMIPVGGYYTINAETAKRLIDRIKPKTVIPMHYRGELFGFPVLATLDDFTKFYKKNEITYLKFNEIDLENKLTTKVLVFNIARS
ncbi:MAG: MBL fold metallo-hydrolase [Tenericutes bacterium]|nr:MBL fold metallo-hydrolase [Mycoplasmatota bacterium]